MAKLKPIERLIKDGNEFDAVRIQLDRDSAYVGHIFHLDRSGKISFAGVGPFASIKDQVNRLESDGSFYSGGTRYFPLGYEILRRAKKK